MKYLDTSHIIQNICSTHVCSLQNLDLNSHLHWNSHLHSNWVWQSRHLYAEHSMLFSTLWSSIRANLKQESSLKTYIKWIYLWKTRHKKQLITLKYCYLQGNFSDRKGKKVKGNEVYLDIMVGLLVCLYLNISIVFGFLLFLVCLLVVHFTSSVASLWTLCSSLLLSFFC